MYVLRTKLYSQKIAQTKADFDHYHQKNSFFRQNTIMAHGMVETEVNMVSYTNDDTTIMYVLIIGALLLTFLVVLGLLRLCCHKTDFIRTAYPVAISNRMFNVSVISVRQIFFFLLLNGTHVQCPKYKQSFQIWLISDLMKAVRSNVWEANNFLRKVKYSRFSDWKAGLFRLEVLLVYFTGFFFL